MFSPPQVIYFCPWEIINKGRIWHILLLLCLACWSPNWPSLFLMILYHFLLVLCYAMKKYWPVSAFSLASESMFATARCTDSINGGKNGCKVAFWGSNSVGLLWFDSPFELTGNISHTIPFILLSCWLLFHLAVPSFKRVAIYWNQSASDMPKPVFFQYFTIYSNFFYQNPSPKVLGNQRPKLWSEFGPVSWEQLKPCLTRFLWPWGTCLIFPFPSPRL